MAELKGNELTSRAKGTLCLLLHLGCDLAHGLAGIWCRFQELVSSTLQPNLAPDGEDEEVEHAPAPAGLSMGKSRGNGREIVWGCKAALTKVENPLLHDSEPVELLSAMGEGCEAPKSAASLFLHLTLSRFASSHSTSSMHLFVCKPEPRV